MKMKKEKNKIIKQLAVILSVLSVCIFCTSCKTAVIKEEIKIKENKIDPSFSIDWSQTKKDTVKETIFVLDTIIQQKIKDSIIIKTRVVTKFDTVTKMQKIEVMSEPIIYYDTVKITETITEKPTIPFYVWIVIGISFLMTLIALIKK